MITTQEKIDIIINMLDNLEKIKQSFIDNADFLKDKYSLSEELQNCDAQKSVLLEQLDALGGVWNAS